MKSGGKLIGLGLMTAISASLCCITPILALLAGTSGLASTFSWLDPFRPYFIVLTFVVLGFAWFQKLKPQKQLDCICDSDEKPSFFQTKKFLGIVTVMAGLMLAFPIYANQFYPKINTQKIEANKRNIKKTEFIIQGMTCTGCEAHVNNEVNKLTGIVKSEVSYENGNAIIEFDKSKTDSKEIELAIGQTGYKITDKKDLK